MNTVNIAVVVIPVILIIAMKRNFAKLKAELKAELKVELKAELKAELELRAEPARKVAKVDKPILFNISQEWDKLRRVSTVTIVNNFLL